MTFFMVLTIAIFLAILALLWCFRGFTRELKNPRKPIGVLVRLKDVEPQGKEIHCAAAANSDGSVRSNPRLRAAGVISLALVLGSR